MSFCVTDEKLETENSTSRDHEPLDSAVEIELAVERGEVTFPMVMKALYLQWPGETTAQYLRQRYHDVYHTALKQFMTKQGGISESFYANEFVAGALLTCKDQLFSNIWWDRFSFDTTKARTLEADINDLRVKAGLYLSECHVPAKDRNPHIADARRCRNQEIRERLHESEGQPPHFERKQALLDKCTVLAYTPA